MPITDYKTGDHYPNDNSMGTQFYWKPLSELLEDHIDHPESKSEGDTGLLTRKHVVIDKTSIHYIGKESNDLEEKQTTGLDDGSNIEYVDVEAVNKSINEKILGLKEEDAPELGVSPATLYRWKACIREGKPIKIKKNIKQSLMNTSQ